MKMAGNILGVSMKNFSLMVQDSFSLMIPVNILGNGMKDKCMDKANSCGQMDQNTKEITFGGIKMDLEYILLRMGIIIRDSGKKDVNMDVVSTTIQTTSY